MVYKKEIVMFWTGLVIGLPLGILLGRWVLSLTLFAKRDLDALNEAVSDMKPRQPTPAH